jgi:hypothetical protein
MSLKSFKSLFLRCKASADVLATPVTFCKALIAHVCKGGEIGDPRLIVRAVKMFSALRRKWTKGPCADECPEIAVLLQQMLHFLAAFRCEDDVLVSSLLCVLCEFEKFIPTTEELLDDLVGCARLTNQDCREFDANPLLFYSSVYSEWTAKDTLHPRIVARHLLEQLLEKSHQAVHYLFTKPVDECLLRCFGFFVPFFEECDLVPALFQWVAPSLGSDPSPIDSAAKVHFLARCATHLPDDSLLSLFETSVIGSLSSPYVVLKLFGCDFLRALVGRGPGFFRIEDVVPHLFDFLPICPTFHAGEALASIAAISPALVLPHASLVITNVLELVRSALEQLSSRDADDDQEDALTGNIALLAALVRASQVVPDDLIDLINLLLVTDLREWGEIYDSLGVLLRDLFLSGSSRTPEVLQVLATRLSDHDHLHGFLTTLLEPIEALIGDDPAAFAADGAAAGVLELCAALIGRALTSDDRAAVCRVAANAGFVDEAAADGCAAIAAGLRAAGSDGVAELELDIAPLVGRKEALPTGAVARIAAAVHAGEVRDPAQLRLFAAALALADSADPTIAALAAETAEAAKGVGERPFVSVYDQFFRV